MKSLTNSNSKHYALAVIGTAAVTAILAPFHSHINSTTVALALLLVVLFVATLSGEADLRC